MNLSPIWFVEKPLDLEHKQYVLLNFLQKVEQGFKANNLADFLYETRYHSKNIECFITIRSLLELRDMPGPTDEQREYFKTIASKPDTDKDLIEAIKIAKWSIKKLQETIKLGAEVFKKIEMSLKPYILGKMEKTTGFLLVRYAGSPVFESYKFIYDTTFKDASFSLYKYYDMPPKATFADVKMRILEEENKSDDMFIAIESNLSYDTKKSVFPVMNHIFSSKIFNRNILGLPHVET